jgi:hypothetical protein
MTDAFAHDQQRRAAIQDRVFAVRGALAEALEQRDGEAALKALGEAYALIDAVPDAQLLYVPGEETASFSLPPEAFQMAAKFPGRCAECSGPIRQGEIMYWVKATRESFCTRCSVRDLMGGGR